MYPNYSDNRYENENRDIIYMQKTVDKQKQSLYYTYETLCHLLSSAENFAGLKNEQYGAYNISTARTYEEMKSEFAWELHCFQTAMKLYKKKYKIYEYPKDLSKEKILSDINRYIKRVSNEKDKALYYAMINIIIGTKIDINFDELFEELDKSANNEFEPKKLKNLIGPLNHILDSIEKKADDGNSEYFIKKYKSKSTENLINESKKNLNMCLSVIIGKRGNLIHIPNSTSLNFEFRNEQEQIFKKITIEGNTFSSKRLYKVKGNKDGYVYIFSIIANKIFCALFDQEPRDYPEKYITILDENYGYGTLKIDDYKPQVPIIIDPNPKTKILNNPINEFL